MFCPAKNPPPKEGKKAKQIDNFLPIVYNNFHIDKMGKKRKSALRENAIRRG